MRELKARTKNQAILLQCAGIYCDIIHDFPYLLKNEHFNYYFKSRISWYCVIKILYFSVVRFWTSFLFQFLLLCLEALKTELVMSSRLRKCIIITCKFSIQVYCSQNEKMTKPVIGNVKLKEIREDPVSNSTVRIYIH